MTSEPRSDPPFLMLVAGGGNCVRLPEGWSIVVRQGDEEGAAVAVGEGGPEFARIDVDDVGPGADVAIWVHVLADGTTVQTGPGVPPWWDGQPQ